MGCRSGRASSGVCRRQRQGGKPGGHWLPTTSTLGRDSKPSRAPTWWGPRTSRLAKLVREYRYTGVMSSSTPASCRFIWAPAGINEPQVNRVCQDNRNGASNRAQTSHARWRCDKNSWCTAGTVADRLQLPERSQRKEGRGKAAGDGALRAMAAADEGGRGFGARGGCRRRRRHREAELAEGKAEPTAGMVGPAVDHRVGGDRGGRRGLWRRLFPPLLLLPLFFCSGDGVDEEPAIRTNTTILLGNIASYLNEGTRKRVLINAFTARALRDAFSPARAAGVMALSATSSYYDMTEIATRVLPSIVVLTIDPDSDVRTKTFEAIEQFLQISKQYHEKHVIMSVNSLNVTGHTLAELCGA
ncbi:hypothetical protein Taro_017746 [Colocasia esculenta]|uniref:Uncharacterized protein n=1 Tax=Colocasia esculenta TaxID=4460 RepID=A0A843UPG3_COLES|nr:hypothetical protein [Colocasia esculenta]